MSNLEVKENKTESKDEEDLAILGDGPAEMIQANSIPIKLTRDRSQPIDIYPWFEITVQDIDVTSQKWHASIEIHLFWQDFSIPIIHPKFAEAGFSLKDADDIPVKLTEIFENKVWEAVQQIEYRYLPETSTVYMLLVVTVEFVERMELQRFPMDRQFLGMDFNAWVGPDPLGARCNWNWITNPPDWVQNEEFRKPFAVRMLSSITEYEMLSPWVDFSKDEQPLSIRLRVERQPGFYFGSIILPNFLIVAAAFASFPIVIDDEEPSFVADRLSISVTLMLTAVAFKYVITDQLPKVTYLTIMDYYLLEGFVMLTLLIFENAFVGISSWKPIETEKARTDFDNFVAYAFFIIWGITHIFWLIVLYFKNFGRIPWDKMDELDSADDDEEEFKYTPINKMIARPQSREVIDEWNKFKGKSPAIRASVYAEQHPELAKSDDDDER